VTRSSRSPLNRLVTGLALIGAAFAHTQTLADSTSQPKMNKHQAVLVIDCMRKRMAASRSSSFNDVKKACKDEVVGESDSALVAFTTP
jgi:hypothetical protein